MDGGRRYTHGLLCKIQFLPQKFIVLDIFISCSCSSDSVRICFPSNSCLSAPVLSGRSDKVKTWTTGGAYMKIKLEAFRRRHQF